MSEYEEEAEEMIESFNKIGAISTGSMLLGIVLVILLYRINPFE